MFGVIFRLFADEVVCRAMSAVARLAANGRECADLLAAHHCAMQVVYKIVSLDGADWRGWSIKATDGMGRSILCVLFPQVPYHPFGKPMAARRDRGAK